MPQRLHLPPDSYFTCLHTRLHRDQNVGQYAGRRNLRPGPRTLDDQRVLVVAASLEDKPVLRAFRTPQSTLPRYFLKPTSQRSAVTVAT